MPMLIDGWPIESELEMVTRIVTQKDQYKTARDNYATRVGLLEQKVRELENTIKIMQKNK